MDINEKKLELFIDDKLWRENIAHQQTKGLKRSVLKFLCDPEFKLSLVSLICDQKYKIAPPYIAEIPKDNGKVRQVFVNQPLDRFILTQINYVYMRLYSKMIHPNCVSYQKGIGVKNIIDNICNKLKDFEGKAGYKIDISKYFDSVNRETLLDMINKIDTGSPLDKVVKDYYMEDIIIDENGELIQRYKSMTQGCAVSTFFADCILRDVDEELSKMNIIYYRYSDDILIIGEDADEALKILERMLIEKGLSLNPKKIEKITAHKWFTFLGVRINGQKRSFSEKSIREFQKHIFEYVSRGSGEEKEIKIAINRINKYLYLNFLRNPNCFGWGEYFFSIVNLEQDIRTLDNYVKDSLRAMYTGKKNIGGLGLNKVTDNCGVLRGKGKNVRANLQRTRQKKEDILEKNGYISMNNMYKLFRINRELYRSFLVSLS